MTGRVSLDVAYSLLNLGTLELYRGRYEMSATYFREALQTFEVRSIMIYLKKSLGFVVGGTSELVAYCHLIKKKIAS